MTSIQQQVKILVLLVAVFTILANCEAVYGKAQPKAERHLESLTVNITVDDMEKSTAFYREVLGFEMIMNVPEKPPYDWAMMKNGSVAVMFQTRASLSEELPEFKEKQLGGGGLTFYIKVYGLDALCERIGQRADIVKQPYDTFYGMREFAIRDCNGYLLVFAEESIEY